jgi:uncharacterized protein YuzE
MDYKKMASIKYDKEANALYVRVAPKKKHIKETISLGEDRFLDLDENGHVIGFEILFPKSMPKEAAKAIARSRDTIELVQ